jgi:hypothetical protein
MASWKKIAFFLWEPRHGGAAILFHGEFRHAGFNHRGWKPLPQQTKTGDAENAAANGRPYHLTPFSDSCLQTCGKGTIIRS